MKRKQHLQSFLSVCNKRLISATARHAGKRPSEQFPAPETMRSLGTNSVPMGFWDHLGGRA